MFDKFTSYLQFEKRYSEHTVLAYGQDLNAFVEFAEVKKYLSLLICHQHLSVLGLFI